jgi:anti-sigma regulatory factor (Ser/Thr protein kinase)
MQTSTSVPVVANAICAVRLVLRIPSRTEWIVPILEYLRDQAVRCGVCPEARANKVMLALDEAITNAVMHGNLELSSELKEQGSRVFAEVLAERSADPRYASRQVTIIMDYDGVRCRWTIADEGPGFDPSRYLARDQTDEAELWLASGRGILLMRAFMDEVQYEQGGRQVTLTLVKDPEAERRKQIRLSHQQAVRVTPVRSDGSIDWSAAQDGVLRNLSPDGVSVLQQQLAGTERILLGFDSAGQPLYIPARVRHCRLLGEGVVEIGCEFDRPESSPSDPRAVEEAIAALLSEASVRLPEDERRAHPRVVYGEKIGLEETLPGEPAYGFGRDLSLSGIAFITTGAVALAQRVLVLPQGARPPLRVRVVIVRCAPLVGGFYDIGARFVGLA